MSNWWLRAGPVGIRGSVVARSFGWFLISWLIIFFFIWPIALGWAAAGIWWGALAVFGGLYAIGSSAQKREVRQRHDAVQEWIGQAAAEHRAAVAADNERFERDLVATIDAIKAAHQAPEPPSWIPGE